MNLRIQFLEFLMILPCFHQDNGWLGVLSCGQGTGVFSGLRKSGLLAIGVNGPGIEASLCCEAILCQMFNVVTTRGCSMFLVDLEWIDHGQYNNCCLLCNCSGCAQSLSWLLQCQPIILVIWVAKQYFLKSGGPMPPLFFGQSEKAEIYPRSFISP